MDIVRCTAAAARLHHEQCSLVQVKALIGLERIYELAYYQQCRVAGIIMRISETLVNYSPARRGKQLYTIAVIVEHLFKESEMQGEHIGDEYGVVLSHLLGKKKSSVLCILKLCHWISSR